MPSEIYHLAFVLRSKNRKAIVKQLVQGRKTQAQLHLATGLYRTHVRRSLLELVEKGLVKCLNPKDRIYKFYELSEKGKSVAKQVDGNE